MVLVDSQSIDSNGLATQFTKPDVTNWKTYYGVNVGVFNAPEATKTNYLFAGNIRYFIYEGSYVNMGDGNATLKYGDLDRDGNNLFTTANPTGQLRAYV